MCNIHDVKETKQNKFGVKYEVYPYRCHRCKKCFICMHAQIGYEYWVCVDGGTVPATPSPGVAV